MPRRASVPAILARHLIAISVLLLSAGEAASVVNPTWASVGDPGNAPDATGFGAVAAPFRISKFETTNAQYVEFLNAVAATDTNLLYSPNMSSGFGGILRSGSSGSYTYSAIAVRANMPVNFVDFFDALRFANWLQNGQPTGAQDDTTTEDGAYTLTTAGITDNSITRNPDALVFLPSQDEWYKAAYYDAVSASYFAYPAGTSLPTSCAAAGSAANTANCALAVGDFRDVGSYTGSASPVGSFDQGGNAWEWNEEIVSIRRRSVRGGAFDSSPGTLASTFSFDVLPDSALSAVGFRLGSLAVFGTPLPEPGTALLLPVLGLLIFLRQTAEQLQRRAGCRVISPSNGRSTPTGPALRERRAFTP